jgi:2-keto-3-deoxy-L-rhamnonate aldolase RhmA
MKSFRERLRAREALIGTFLKTPSPIVCEVLAATDLDYVCLDIEHAPFGRLETDSCLAALRAGGKPSIARVADQSASGLLSVLDSGATAVLVPHIKSAADAAAVVKAAHFGPGGRGYAGSTRAAGYAGKAMADHLKDSAAATTVMVQIEDLEAIEAIDSIAAVDGVDCLFIGRMDLTVALGATSHDDAVVLDAVKRICAAGRKAGRVVGMFIRATDEISRWLGEGATFYMVGSDHGFLKEGARSLVSAFHQSRTRSFGATK